MPQDTLWNIVRGVPMPLKVIGLVLLAGWCAAIYAIVHFVVKFW